MKIVLLYGGSCGERFVSFSSSKAIYKSLIDLGHKVIPIDPAQKTQKNYLESHSLEEFKEVKYANDKKPKHVNILFDNINEIKDKIKPDIVFNGLHGGYGEDGLIQDLFDRMKIAYTGSGALSSKIAMNKHVSKQIMRDEGVPTARWQLITSSKTNVHDLVDDLGLPMVIKPNNGGSSVGLSIVKDKSEIIPALKLALKYDKHAIVEEFIPGREITVSILDVKTYPIIEIKPKSGVYDYESKYTKGKTEYIVPAEIDSGIAMQIHLNALRCFEALGMSVYGRIDYRLTKDNAYYCLEGNTLPGMTDTSLVPKSVAKEDLSFTELVEKILNLSLESHQ